MDKSRVSKHPSLEVISEIEPNSYSSQRTHYTNSHHPRNVQLPNEIYEKSTIQLPSSSPQNGHINLGYSGSSQNSIQLEGSTPSVSGYVFYSLVYQAFDINEKVNICFHPHKTSVYREQYWVCSEPLRCRNWTRRERILFFVLLGLSTIVVGLVAVVSFISRRDNNTPPQAWLPWL